MSDKSFRHIADADLPDLGDVPQFHGDLDASAHAFAIVVSRFNHAFTHELVTCAVHTLKEHGAAEDRIKVYWVPGAFEVPFLLEQLAQQGTFSALIGLGVVIEGETPHADLITSTATAALSDIARKHEVPVIDGIISARTVEQAQVRAAPGDKNRGIYAARAAIEMASLLARARQDRS